MASKGSKPVPKHRDIAYFFPSKKLTDKLPPSNDFYKENLLKKSNNLENAVVDSEQNSFENGDGDLCKIKELQYKLDEANAEIHSLKDTVATQNSDIKKLKYLVNSANRLCVAKDLKIESLLKKCSTMVNKDGENIISTPLLFENFKNEINPSILKQLRSVKEGQSYDSSFVLTLLRHFYANNFNLLLTKSATGVGKGKRAMTPEKKKIINEIFKERILLEENDGIRVELRLNRLNILINDAIYNIGRPLKRLNTSQTQTNTNPNENDNTFTHNSTEPPPLISIASKENIPNKRPKLN